MIVTATGKSKVARSCWAGERSRFLLSYFSFFFLDLPRLFFQVFTNDDMLFQGLERSVHTVHLNGCFL